MLSAPHEVCQVNAKDFHAAVIHKASGVISDPEIEWSGFVGDELNAVQNPTRLDLLRGKLVLVFRAGVLIAFTPIEVSERLPFEALLYFISYCSRVNYNIVYPPLGEDFPDQLSSHDQVTFLVQRLVRVEREEVVGGERGVFIHHELEPCQINLHRQDLENFLAKGNLPLYFAIAYYLKGCENLGYFLVEFHKAVEVIKNSFKNEQEMLRKLKAYDLKQSDYKKIGRYCNDALNPIDIARHAPKPQSAPMRVVDFRHLLSDPFSREVWTESVRIVRKTIDAYFSYTCQKPFSSEIKI